MNLRKIIFFRGNIGQYSPRHPVCGFFRNPSNIDNNVRIIHKIIQFVPHRKNSVRPLEVVISECTMKKNGCVLLRITWNALIHCVGQTNSV